jgi:mRNA interferase MazF
VSKGFVPDRGDLVWLHSSRGDGGAGGERRPALVISPRAYNAASGRALLCPVTTWVKGYPFEVALPKDSPVPGAVLVDQVKNLDWKARLADRIGSVPPRVIEEVRAKIRTLTE